MWIGLCLALVLIGIILVGVWSRLIKHIVAKSAAAEALQTSPSK